MIKYGIFFHVKIQIFVTANSDPDSHGSALVWLPGSGSALRQKAGSGSAFKLLRIRYTGLVVTLYRKLR